MKLVIVRHAEPDYSIDSLTPVGWTEAKILSDRISKMTVKEFYCSPLGRARDTASFTLEKTGRKAEILPWLREFPARVLRPHITEPSVAWDWLPADWTNEPAFFQFEQWTQVDAMAKAGVKEQYDYVVSEFDRFLAQHGYVRENNLYRAVAPNEDTIVFFCHFGLECVLLSRILNIPPMLLWHGTCAAPTSVTIVNTEERQAGYAYFRMSTFGDTSHLYAAGQEPSFAARFCETYANFDPERDTV